MPVLALALGLAAPGPSVAQAPPPPAAAPIAVAAAYTAAWNAHDLPAVLALFAPDAVVRERRGEVPPAVWDAHDPQVVRDYLDANLISAIRGPDTFRWLTGHQEIAAWAAAAFARHHRVVAGPYHATGDTVSWRHREFADPFQLAPGVGPAEVDAEAVVRGGWTTRLSLVQSPASVEQQRREVAAALNHPAPTHAAAPRGAEPRPRLSGAPGTAEPTGAAWPLVLGGLALLAAVTMALRRRRLP
jgi:ketosteroid isomerase-like protein